MVSSGDHGVPKALADLLPWLPDIAECLFSAVEQSDLTPIVTLLSAPGFPAKLPLCIPVLQLVWLIPCYQ